MALEEASIRAQVSRIIDSKNLRLSEGQCRLLTYLADKSLAGEADELKEYVVGVDAFGKPPTYDPRQESVVRTQVARLRQKLADYYHTEGTNDPIFVDLPKGGFKVNFEERITPSETPKAAEPPLPGWRRRETLLAAGLALAMVAAIYFSIRPVRAERALPVATLTPELQQLWTPILNSNRPLVVCVATPSTGSSA